MSHDVLGRGVPSASSSLILGFADIFVVLPNVDHLLWSCHQTVAGTMVATSGSPVAGPVWKTVPFSSSVQHHCLWICNTGMRINLDPWPMSISSADPYNCRPSIALKVANISHLCVPSVAIG